MSSTTTLTIRLALAGDADALQALEAMDAHRLPGGATLLAEDGDGVTAAVHVASGTAVADPFRASASAVVLLRVRAAQLRGETRPSRSRGLSVRRWRPAASSR